MAIKPILFNTEMVQAILNGRKTVTRRIVKPQPKMQLAYICMGHNHGKWSYPPPHCMEQSGWNEKYRRIEGLTTEDEIMCWTPPCRTDDILYVRETFAPMYPDDVSRQAVGYMYKADDGMLSPEEYDVRYPNGAEYLWEGRWKPSIHMPKEAARIFLKVTDVRVERLQDITAQGIRDEGLSSMAVHCGDMEIAQKEFAILWDSTIKKSDLDTYGWKANPYVWVIEFERCEKPKEF